MTDFGEGENLPYIIAYLEADCNFYSRFRQKGEINLACAVIPVVYYYIEVVGKRGDDMAQLPAENSTWLRAVRRAAHEGRLSLSLIHI